MPNFTKKAIEASFMKLLNERPLNKITVKDIVDDCGINRNSFYYHFEDIPSLMKSIMNEAFDELIAQYPAFDTFEDCIKASIAFVLQNKRAFLHIYNSTSRDIFEQYLWDACEYCVSAYIRTYFSNYNISDSDREIISNYYKCLIYGQTSAWLAVGMKEDLIKQYDRLLELSNGMVAEMFRRSEKS